MLFAKWRPFCLNLHALTESMLTNLYNALWHHQTTSHNSQPDSMTNRSHQNAIFFPPDNVFTKFLRQVEVFHNCSWQLYHKSPVLSALQYNSPRFTQTILLRLYIILARTDVISCIMNNSSSVLKPPLRYSLLNKTEFFIIFPIKSEFITDGL